MPHSPTVVLVHGAFADASGFAGIIHELDAAGYAVVAPPNPLRSLSGDAAAIHAVVAAIDGPVLLVGHSYGGAVITQASATLDHVVGLVYFAGFGLAVGDSCATVTAPYPPALLATSYSATPYAAPGAPGGPDLSIDRDPFHEVFCGDLSDGESLAMWATQRPLSAAAFTEPATAAGWATRPSWFMVSEHDNAISPEAQRFMAARMGATTDSIVGSHCAFISHPRTAAAFLLGALDALDEGTTPGSPRRERTTAL